MIPTTLDEAIDELVKLNIKPDEINKPYIRNKWELWNGSDLAQWFYLKEIYHADDMSSIIVLSYERYINNIPINLESQIKFYQKYWEKAIGPNHLKVMKSNISINITTTRELKINEILK